MIWPGLLVACAACYGLKLAGVFLPQAWLQDPRIQRTVPLLPVALLSALIAILTFSTGHRLVLDVRAAALAVEANDFGSASTNIIKILGLARTL